VEYAIVSNGFAEGPAQALRDFLVAREASVVTIFHPLTPEQGKRHVVTRYEDGEVQTRPISMPLHAPASFVLDPIVPLLPPRVHAWFGFNPLACARGLAARGTRRAERVFLWSVDFVPDRFGEGTVPTRIYDAVDRLSCRRADGRVELSEAAREGRNARHRLTGAAAHAHVVPMGAWLDRVPTSPPGGSDRRRVAFLGHLVERQGVITLLQALALLDDVEADIVGGGPLEETLRAQAHGLGLDTRVTFHGYVPDHRDVEHTLAAASVAVAPYRASGDSFTRFADPGKLKAYLAAGLPIVLTDVPPNARELAAEAGAQLTADDPRALATAIAETLASAETWRARREAALRYARRFDWNVLLADVLEALDVSPRTKPKT
jgi:glycosyltransferase involved in cell wall biosynthesis